MFNDVETLADVEDRLAECHELWRRSPGAGKRPFAGDAPWELMERKEPGDYGGDGADGVSSSRRPRPALDAGEVGLRDTMTAWLQWIEDPIDRKLVWLASGTQDREEGRVPWKELKRWLGWPRSQNALAWRYKRGLATILCRLRGWPSRRVTALASAGIAREREEFAA